MYIYIYIYTCNIDQTKQHNNINTMHYIQIHTQKLQQSTYINHHKTSRSPHPTR